MRISLAAALSLVMGAAARPASAQVTGTNVQPGTGDTYTLSVTSRLVVETVTVKDKKGNPIKGLTAKDFTITEDGVAQEIKFSEQQSLPETPSLLVTPPGGEDIKIYNKLGTSQISSESPGTIKYKDRRLMALYIDMSAMPIPDQMRALDAAQKFIRTQMTSADLLAILRYSGASVDIFSRLWWWEKGREMTNLPATPAPPTPARPSARTIASSISSTPTVSSPRCRPRPRCLAS